MACCQRGCEHLRGSTGSQSTNCPRGNAELEALVAGKLGPHLSTLWLMSSSVIPLYVRSSFHTGFSVFL